MGHTSEDRMCCNRGVATAQSMVSPPRMKSHFPVAALTGYASALPTPFKGDSIDEEAFARFCEWQIGQGISARARRRRYYRRSADAEYGRTPSPRPYRGRDR